MSRICSAGDRPVERERRSRRTGATDAASSRPTDGEMTLRWGSEMGTRQGSDSSVAQRRREVNRARRRRLLDDRGMMEATGGERVHARFDFRCRRASFQLVEGPARQIRFDWLFAELNDDETEAMGSDPLQIVRSRSRLDDGREGPVDQMERRQIVRISSVSAC